MSISTQVFNSVSGIILHLVQFCGSGGILYMGMILWFCQRSVKGKIILKFYLNFLWGMNHNIILDFINLLRKGRSRF